jgi:hypothetical protein
MFRSMERSTSTSPRTCTTTKLTPPSGSSLSPLPVVRPEPFPFASLSFNFPRPFLLSDLGVTCLVQGLATFLIVPTLSLPDLRSRRISPLPSGPYPRVSHLPDPRSLLEVWSSGDKKGLGFWSKMLLRYWAEGTEAMGLFQIRGRGGVKGWLGRLVWSVGQGVLWGAVLFFLFW